MKKILLWALSLGMAVSVSAQRAEVRNVIYMIGDGMGIAHVTAAMLQADSPMAIQKAQAAGLSVTRSADNPVTDSAAGGTALATGHKTNNGSIGVLPSGEPVESVMAIAKGHGMATGIIATVSITDATPAAFYAHVPKRKQHEDIAAQFVDSDIDVAIGGGAKYFTQRGDSRNLTDELSGKGYSVVRSIDDMKTVGEGKMLALLASGDMPFVTKGRPENFLAEATRQALDMLKIQNKKGFFLMVEGSLIDHAAHNKDYEGVLAETYDFDRAVRVAMDFADANPGTLIVITADHETGGMTLPASSFSISDGKYDILKPHFSTGGHTASMVGVYAYGAGAQEFGRLMDNTDIPKTIERLMKAVE